MRRLGTRGWRFRRRPLPRLRLCLCRPLAPGFIVRFPSIFGLAGILWLPSVVRLPSIFRLSGISRFPSLAARIAATAPVASLATAGLVFAAIRLFGGGRLPVDPGDVLPQHPLDGLDGFGVPRCDEGGGEALAAGASGAADAVDIIFRHVWERRN